MTHQTQLLTLLKTHQPADQTETTHLQNIRHFVEQTPACTSRSTLSGHITASAWILSPEGDAALLTHHRKLNRWFQPGGHVDASDETIQAAALREAQEESGIDDLRLLDQGLFDVDVHVIPARKTEPEHYHYDVRFVFQAPTRNFAISEESNDLAWIELDKISELVSDESVLRMVRKSAAYQYQYRHYYDPQAWTIPRIVLEQAERQPQRTAIRFVDGPEWTFADLRTKALACAGWLRDQGVKTNTRVAVMTDEPRPFCRCWLGLAMLGATMVAINTSMRGEPLQHQLSLAQVTHIIAADNLLETVQPVCGSALLYSTATLENTSPDKTLTSSVVHKAKHSDLSCIMFTSGTSGPSKGVLMPQAHCVLFAVGTIDNLQLHSGHTFYICLPLFHANGLMMQLLACLMSGATAVIRQRFSASNWLSDIRHYGATHTNMLGALSAFIVAQPETAQDGDHQLQVAGGAPLPTASDKALRERFGIHRVVPMYGMTEVNIPLYGWPDEAAPGTCGRVYDRYFEVEIRDSETDEPIATGETGEIVVRPKQPYGFMSGYVGMPEKTLEAWRNFWFHTGDAGLIDEKSRFVFVDRIKDCIRRRGENISSYEVEQAFLAIDGIAEAAAYAVPAGADGMEDEVMVALEVRDNAEVDLSEWVAQAAQNLATFAVPRYIRVVDALPKTPTGKIRKVQLRKEGVTADSVTISA